MAPSLPRQTPPREPPLRTQSKLSSRKRILYPKRFVPVLGRLKYRKKNGDKTMTQGTMNIMQKLSIHANSSPQTRSRSGEACGPIAIAKIARFRPRRSAKGVQSLSFVFGTLSVTCWSLFLTRPSLFSLLFCQTPFAGPLLRQGENLPFLRAKNQHKLFLYKVFRQPFGSWTSGPKIVDVRTKKCVFLRPRWWGETF